MSVRVRSTWVKELSFKLMVLSCWFELCWLQGYVSLATTEQGLSGSASSFHSSWWTQAASSAWCGPPLPVTGSFPPNRRPSLPQPRLIVKPTLGILRSSTEIQVKTGVPHGWHSASDVGCHYLCSKPHNHPNSKLT